MNLLVGVERRLLAEVARTSEQSKRIDDETMKGLALFYGYDVLYYALRLLQDTHRLGIYHTDGTPPRRLYQFHAGPNQMSVCTLPTSNFCTCWFYQKHVLRKPDFFACPHNVAIKLHEQVFRLAHDIEIEIFDVSHDYLIEKIGRLLERCCESD